MNGRAARALRREVRRSVGEEAIGIIDAQTNAINHQILPNLNSSQARLAHVEDRVHALETRTSVLEGLTAIHDDHLETLQTVVRGLLPTDLSFSQRVRWLVCGR